MSGQHVKRNDALDRYELSVDGHIAVAEFKREGGVVTFTHTGVPSLLEGRGVGSELIAGALEDVRKRNLKIVAKCPFVAKYVDSHSDARDLLAS